MSICFRKKEKCEILGSESFTGSFVGARAGMSGWEEDILAYPLPISAKSANKFDYSS